MSLLQGIRALVLFGLCALASFARASDVSGDITTNATWTFAASPYNVTGSVRVVNGAVLTIEAGVLIYMAPGTGFTVDGGRLIAVGTSVSRIVFTSVRDQAGASPPAAPGDWQQFRLLSSNGSQPSSLTYVTVRFGQGMLINSASPTLQTVALENNAGPAITLDLSSSPQGSGLTASGNVLNGIAVPAGEVTQRARWALVGIPYVVSGGILHVGARPSPLTLAPVYRYLEPGESSDFLLSLSEPAAASTPITLTSSAPEIASVNPNVTIPAGAFSASITVNALTGGNATITASNPSGDVASAGVTVAPRPALQIFESPFVLSAGRTRDVFLSRGPASAFVSAATVTLSVDPTGVAQLPATIVIPAGSAGVSIPVQGLSAGTANLVASAVGYIDAGSVITVEPLTMRWPTQVKVPIGTVTAQLVFSDVVPPGGMTVTFESSDPTRLTLPASLPVPAGATGLNVPLTGVDVGTASLTASNASYGQATVNAEVERLTAYFDVSERTIPAGFTEPFTVVLSNPAPQGGVTVTLTSSDPAIATPVQPSVAIAAGASSALVDIRALTEGSATITTGGNNLDPGSLMITVGPPAVLSFSQSSNTVGRGLQSRSTRIQLHSGASEFRPRRDLEIALTNPDGASLIVPATVQLLAGSSEVVMATVGVLITAAPIAVHASAAEVQSTSAALEVNVVESTLAFVGLDDVRSPQSARDEFWLQWQVPGVVEQQGAASSQSIEISIVDAAPANLVDGIYDFFNSGSSTSTTAISAGGWFSSSRFVGVPSVFGNYKVRAAIAGLGEWTSSEQRSVGLNLQFSASSFVSGKLLDSRFVKIRRQLGADAYAPNTPLSVNLIASDPSRVTIDAVVIPANASEVAVSIIGRELTANTLVNAVALDYASAPALNVSVVEPTYEFYQLEGTRAVGAARDFFALVFKVLSSQDVNQSARLVTANVDVIGASPIDIVPGIFRVYSGGSTSSFINYLPSHGYVGGFVGTPTAVGSYALRATVTGLSTPLDSVVQTVTGNTLRFDEASVTVGKGLRWPARLSLPVPPTSPPLAVNHSCASNTCSVPLTQNINWTEVTVPVVGENVGADTLTSVSSLPEHGATTLPVQVVPFIGRFFYRNPDECSGGWYITVEPGVANQTLEASITIVDQNPPGIFTESYSAVIPEGDNESGYCPGFELDTPASAGTYRLRATIPNLGTFYSETRTAEATLSAYPLSVVLARGLNSRVGLYSTIASPMPAEISANCVPAPVCAPQSPVVIPASESSVEFVVLGTQNGPATLALNAPGYTGTSVSVEVRDPTLVIETWQTTVQVGQDLSVRLRLFPQGMSDGDYAYATSAISLALTGGATTAQIPPTVEIPNGEHLVEFNLRGLEPGDYTFTVNWPGVGIFSSPTIVVTP